MCCLREGITSDLIKITNSTESPRHAMPFTPEMALEAYSSVKEERPSVWSAPNSLEPCRAATPVCLLSPPSCQSTTPSCTDMPSSIVSQLLVSCLKFCRSTARSHPTSTLY
jgi:hypothetical protein